MGIRGDALHAAVDRRVLSGCRGVDVAQRHRQHATFIRLDNAEVRCEFDERRVFVDGHLQGEARGIFQGAPRVVIELFGHFNGRHNVFRKRPFEADAFHHLCLFRLAGIGLAEVIACDAQAHCRCLRGRHGRGEYQGNWLGRRATGTRLGACASHACAEGRTNMKSELLPCARCNARGRGDTCV